MILAELKSEEIASLRHMGDVRFLAVRLYASVRL